MDSRMISAICYYLRRVVPHGPEEAAELERIIFFLERLVDGPVDG